MGEAKRRRESAEAAGIELPLEPKIRKVTWSFELQPEGYETFKKVHAYMRKKDARIPESEESFAAGLLTIGLKTLVARIEKERQKSSVQLHTPADMVEVSRRLQAIKEGM